jgi:hypothetical protein
MGAEFVSAFTNVKDTVTPPPLKHLTNQSIPTVGIDPIRMYST